jgi:hypothetical protein
VEEEEVIDWNNFTAPKSVLDELLEKQARVKFDYELAVWLTKDDPQWWK